MPERIKKQLAKFGNRWPSGIKKSRRVNKVKKQPRNQLLPEEIKFRSATTPKKASWNPRNQLPTGPARAFSPRNQPRPSLVHIPSQAIDASRAWAFTQSGLGTTQPPLKSQPLST